ncbi:four helix bundle protein [bacterium]|nr:four helix bundle protein [bacterium]
MASFRSLLVWQKAHELTLAVYRVGAGFPAQERFALTDQLRRAAASVPANTADGYGTGLDRVFLHHLARAQGSLAETRYFLLLAQDLNYLGPQDYEGVAGVAAEASKLLTAFRAKVRERCSDQHE